MIIIQRNSQMHGMMPSFVIRSSNRNFKPPRKTVALNCIELNWIEPDSGISSVKKTKIFGENSNQMNGVSCIGALECKHNGCTLVNFNKYRLFCTNWVRTRTPHSTQCTCTCTGTQLNITDILSPDWRFIKSERFLFFFVVGFFSTNAIFAPLYSILVKRFVCFSHLHTNFVHRIASYILEVATAHKYASHEITRLNKSKTSVWQASTIGTAG